MGAPIELVIFDCDGVLVDIERIAVRLQITIGAQYGWTLTESDIVNMFIGQNEQTIRQQLTDRLGPDTAANWLDTFETMQTAAMETELTAVDGVADALDAIVTPTCVASNGSHGKMRRTLGQTGLFHRFEDRIFSATEVARGKPAPDIYLYAAQQMRVPPDRCAVVEDSHYGVRAARAAGMRVFAYAGGVTPERQLTGPNTVIFHEMRQLPALLSMADR